MRKKESLNSYIIQIWPLDIVFNYKSRHRSVPTLGAHAVPDCSCADTLLVQLLKVHKPSSDEKPLQNVLVVLLGLVVLELCVQLHTLLPT